MRREFCVCFSHATIKMETVSSQPVFFFFILNPERTELGYKQVGCAAIPKIGFWEFSAPRREDIFVVSADKLAIYLSVLF